MSNIQQFLVDTEAVIQTADGKHIQVSVAEADTLGVYGVRADLPGFPHVFVPWSNVISVAVA